jgi:hypothetical protein
MRITHETLIKYAQEAVENQIKLDRNLLAACLVGSVLTDEPLVAGSTDIDLILIHPAPPQTPREVQRVTDDVSLDIYHYDQSIFFQPRHLRLDPWLGPTIQNHPKLLHDSRHWFEFTQASVGSQFYRPDYCISRSRTLLDRARDTWKQIDPSGGEIAHSVSSYLNAVEYAANAVACLSGPPLTIRRFLPNYPERVHAVDRPGLMTGLVGLISAGETDAAAIHTWAQDWQSAFDSASSRTGQTDPELNAARRHYLLSAIECLMESDHPTDALWPILKSWTAAVKTLSRTTIHHQPWMEAISILQLDSEHLPERLKALDAYLDTVDETLESWARANGA